jgi:5-(hydroxymethyl)furfural/furfural oxidase
VVDKFDVIVVGAGSAGAVLAARLSQDPATQVLLVEAGPNQSTSHTPAGVRGLNWASPLEVPGRIWPNLQAQRTVEQGVTPYLRGRGVGGSSAVNALIALRGTPDDYDSWAGQYGCDGWGWAEMLAAFVALEDDAEFGDLDDHGKGGPLPVTREPGSPVAPLDDAVRTALVELGFPVCDDYHQRGATGLSRLAFNVRAGRRASTNDAYLEPARGRANLTIEGDVLVDRLELDGRRAVGVVTADGTTFEADEVIIAAGAIHSPAILLRSGIGPDVGLPVGDNLIEHPVVAIVLELNAAGQPASVHAPMASSVLRYTSGHVDGGDNDMQLAWMSPISSSDDGLSRGLMFPAVMHVFSRGTVRLHSNDPNDDPEVDVRMLTDERDLVRLREGFRLAERVLDQPVLASIATLTTPAADVDLADDDQLDIWMKTNINDYKHPVGTCRMGHADDPAAVVDTTCRVRGFERLRVCDASVMPDLPRANTHITTVAIAEHLARRLRS